MMNAGESFARRRLIYRPTEKAHATGRGAVKAQKRKIIRAAGQEIGPARGFGHAADRRRRCIAGCCLKEPIEFDGGSHGLAANAMSSRQKVFRWCLISGR